MPNNGKIRSLLLCDKIGQRNLSSKLLAVIFFCVDPSYEETSFQPPSMVCNSVIIHFTHSNLQILNGPLCEASM